MDQLKMKLLRAKVKSLKATLANGSRGTKTDHVTTGQAEEFNKILKELGTAYPEGASSLPAEIRSTTVFAEMGISNATLVDLEIYADQVLAMLDVLEASE
jgi:hypothetical protein